MTDLMKAIDAARLAIRARCASDDAEDIFIRDQFTALRAAAREHENAVIERCAKVCAALDDENYGYRGRELAAWIRCRSYCAAAIRALKEPPK